MQSFDDILFWHENIFKVDHLKQVYLTKLTDDARKTLVMLDHAEFLPLSKAWEQR